MSDLEQMSPTALALFSAPTNIVSFRPPNKQFSLELSTSMVPVRDLFLDTVVFGLSCPLKVNVGETRRGVGNAPSHLFGPDQGTPDELKMAPKNIVCKKLPRLFPK